jgi:hypothetical protein
MIVDLVRVRQGREKLALLAQKHPELRGISSAENVSNWIETLQLNGEKNVVEYEKTCEYILCRKVFISGRKDARFHTDACRTAAGKMRDKREPSDLAKLMERAIEFDSQFYGGPSSLESKRARNDALRAVYDAIGAELGIVHERPGSVPELHEVPVVESAKGQHERPELHEVPVVEVPVVEVPVVEVPVVEVPVVEVPVVEVPVVEVPVVEVRERLRAFMAETSFGQSKIAKLVGVGQPTISQFLSGKTKGSEDFRRAIIDLVSQDHGMDKG